MVRIWYMDDNLDDPQSEHIEREIDTQEMCDRTGVEYWYFHPDHLQSEHSSLEKLKNDRHYTYEDEIVVQPTMENYETKLKTFFKEHLHSDEEIRLVLEGSGYFDCRDYNDRWIRINVFPGDLIILPAGMYHRFIPDKNNFIRAKRFFVGEPIWVPINRPADDHPARKSYLEEKVVRYHNGNQTLAAGH
ncbi:unnamed protein product [Didymodactylos carnosus]|uniref:Acireductone dioxygenase n=2 Tax=Didymodactylos carnosus TaxID=1234261 RepID=A0A814IHR4_9BILA|nr:unnamed protein product [Didymodactylos carnosus]CAF3794847.1 unnamed protein product [Didymodactylos carnosus]